MELQSLPKNFLNCLKRNNKQQLTKVRTATSIHVTAPALKETDNPLAKDSYQAASVVLTLDLTEIFIPTYPAAPEKKSTYQKSYC